MDMGARTVSASEDCHRNPESPVNVAWKTPTFNSELSSDIRERENAYLFQLLC
jgi:hypothetical protein